MQDDSLQDGRCKMMAFKVVPFARLQATNENARNGKENLPKGASKAP